MITLIPFLCYCLGGGGIGLYFALKYIYLSLTEHYYAVSVHLDLSMYLFTSLSVLLPFLHITPSTSGKKWKWKSGLLLPSIVLNTVFICWGLTLQVFVCWNNFILPLFLKDIYAVYISRLFFFPHTQLGVSLPFFWFPLLQLRK